MSGPMGLPAAHISTSSAASCYTWQAAAWRGPGRSWAPPASRSSCRSRGSWGQHGRAQCSTRPWASGRASGPWLRACTLWARPGSCCRTPAGPKPGRAHGRPKPPLQRRRRWQARRQALLEAWPFGWLELGWASWWVVYIEEFRPVTEVGSILGRDHEQGLGSVFYFLETGSWLWTSAWLTVGGCDDEYSWSAASILFVNSLSPVNTFEFCLRVRIWSQSIGEKSKQLKWCFWWVLDF